MGNKSTRGKQRGKCSDDETKEINGYKDHKGIRKAKDECQQQPANQVKEKDDVEAETTTIISSNPPPPPPPLMSQNILKKPSVEKKTNEKQRKKNLFSVNNMVKSSEKKIDLCPKLSFRSESFDKNVQLFTGYNFSTHSEDNFSEDENYGFLPLMTIQKILLFLEPADIFVIMQSCELLYNIIHRSIFWEEYFHLHYETEKNTFEEEGEEKITWKKLFFNNFVDPRKVSTKTDYEYLRKYSEGGKGIYWNRTYKIFDEYDLYILGGSSSSSSSSSCDDYTKQFKSSLFRNHTNKFHNNILRIGKPTYGDSFYMYKNKRKTPQDKAFVVRSKIIYDEKSYPMSWRGIHGMYFCFLLNDRSSFNNTKEKFEMLRGKLYQNTTSIILIGLKIINKEKDEEDEEEEEEEDNKKLSRTVQFEEAEKYAKENEMRGYFECILFSGSSLKEKILGDQNKSKDDDDEVFIKKKEKLILKDENVSISLGFMIDLIRNNENRKREKSIFF